MALIWVYYSSAMTLPYSTPGNAHKRALFSGLYFLLAQSVSVEQTLDEKNKGEPKAEVLKCFRSAVHQHLF